MEIREYTEYDEKEILPLYEAAGWVNYTKDPQRLAQAYSHSLCVLAAYQQGKLAGVVRAVGDGYSILYIQDLLVLPRFQRQGVGTALVRAMLEKYPRVYQTVLMTDDSPATAAFYGSLGFKSVQSMGCAAYLKMRG